MSVYNTANVKSFYQGMTAAQWRTFADNIVTNGLLSEMQNHFTVVGKYATDLSNIDSRTQKAFAEGCRHAADGIDSSYTMDFSGVSISDTSTGSNYTSSFTVHVDVIVVWTGGSPGFCFSFWHTHGNSN